MATKKKSVTKAESKRIAKKAVRAHERKPMSKGGHGRK